MAGDESVETKRSDLRKTRGAYKGQVTNLEQWVEAETQRDEHDVEAKLDMLNMYYTSFVTIQDQLELLDKDEKGERDKMDARVFAARAKLKRLRYQLIGKATSSLQFVDATGGTSSSTNPAPVHVEVTAPSEVPLPKLPKFNGDDYLDYPNFINTFDALIGSQAVAKLSATKKFSILRDALEGRAWDAVKHLLMTDANYTVALDILKQRFYKPRLIFESLLKKLHTMPKANNASSLRKLLDSVGATLKALEGLPATPEQIGFGLLIHHVLKNVDEVTLDKWEEQSCTAGDALPTWDELYKFLDGRANVLESIAYLQKEKPRTPSTTKKTYHSMQKCCLFCSGKCLELSQCKEFGLKNPTDRYNWVKANQRCVFCLEKLPHTEKCTPKRCDKCKKRHHTLLHFDDYKPRGKTVQQSTYHEKKEAPAITSNEERLALNTSSKSISGKTQILGTAIIKLQNNSGEWVPARALIDGGSMTHFLTKRVVSKLHLPLRKESAPVIGLFGVQKIRQSVKVNFKSAVSDYSDTFEALVLPEFEHVHPDERIGKKDLQLPNNLQLADPAFDQPQRVDVIIGVGLAYKLLMVGQIKLLDDLLLQKTQLGWVVAGEIDSKSSKPCNRLTLLAGTNSNDDNLNELLPKFWEIDRVPPPPKKWSPTELFCEQHFRANTTRDAAGKFIVRIPFTTDPAVLGESYSQARSRFEAGERKRASDRDLDKQYKDFMREYLELGHMERVSEPISEKLNYLPHHGVLKLDSSSTKCRVVFDASAPTSTRVSLNDVTPHGPTVQPSLFSILLRFRYHKVAICGDIAKMYRQIWVHPEDRRHQCILWRSNKSDQLATYKLKTVTYGTSSAPFLAIRCVNELATTSPELPVASKVLLEDTYVDNTLSGGRNPTEALEIYDQANRLLSKGGFEMRKWYSNSDAVMKSIPIDQRETLMNIGEDDVMKTLGLRWSPQGDHFVFSLDQPLDNTKWTKRKILSHVSKLFDPIGFFGPVIVRLKIYLQRLWTLKLHWDESLPQEALTTWLSLLAELPQLADIKIPRYVFYDEDKVEEIQLQCYADASSLAYGTVFFVRCRLEGGMIVIHNLCSKSKIAPLKKVTLPRLELLGAVLLSELFQAVWPSLSDRISKVVCWLDSQVALTWVTNSPHKYDDFVASRSTLVQDRTPNCQYRHIPGKLNPADILSRGASPKALLAYGPWRRGPEYLYLPEDEWNFDELEPIDENDDRLERKPTIFCCYARVKTDLVQEYKFHGSLNRLQKTFAFMARAIDVFTHAAPAPATTALTSADLERGLKLAVRIVQAHEFHNEYRALKAGDDIPTGSALCKLAPFMDNDGLIRVGGRLENAPDMSYDERHPMVLPKKHGLTQAIFYFYHWKLLHVGPRSLLAAIRRKFWPLGGQVKANSTFHQCLVCSRHQRGVFRQVMGNLPEGRVQPFERCFEVVGMDLCGPFTISNPGRGSRPSEYHVAVFVCFRTNAIQLHYVSSEKTDSIINTLLRFMSRAGRPLQIWSDNATNFHGAANVFKFVDWSRIDEWCRVEQRTDWKFIPARSPHMGGLWESAVKLTKKHLLKVTKGVSLHFDAFLTFLAMIESILNSRPITPLSNNPVDGQPLTPAHFMVGGPILTLPDPYPRQIPRGRSDLLRTWTHLCELKQHWFKRWQLEVRQAMQARAKWHTASKDIKCGKMVMIVEKDKAPYAWRVARKTQVYPGRDGGIRVVDVTTTPASGEQRTFRRAITELVPLPTEDNNNSSHSIESEASRGRNG